ncbi:MAG: hypothetical protein AAGB34_11320, partial [Planctomycetota bacterium]
LQGFERDCNLSEDIIRFMVTKAEHLTEEEIKAHDQRVMLGDEAQLRSEEVPAFAGAESAGERDEAQTFEDEQA